MSNLGPQQQNESFDGILQIPGGVTSSLQPVQDGMGNLTGLWLSSSGTNATTSDTFIASNGGSAVSGAVPRLISDGFGDYLSVKDFGVVGDGTTNDTTAFQSAIDHACAKKLSLYVPCGTYSCDTLVVSTSNRNNGFSLISSNPVGCVIQKRSSDGKPLLQINNGSLGFYNDILISNITFSGIAGNTTAAISAEDIVRSLFSNIVVKNALIGIDFRGGISNAVTDSVATNNNIGINLQQYPSAYMSGFPNNNSITNSQIVNNATYGIYFDGGQLLNVTSCDIEGNGTAGNISTAGVWAGTDLGSSPGITIRDTWFEDNRGQAAVVFSSGRNFIGQSYFVANAYANAPNDVYISGGRYVIDTCDFDTSKPANIYETSGVSATNYIINSDDNYHESIDTLKTVVLRGNNIVSNKFYIGGDDGAGSSLEITSVANSVNHVNIYGNATGGAPVIRAKGTDTNIALQIYSQGAANVQMFTNSGSNKAFDIVHVANSVNYISSAGAVAGGYVNLSAQGSSTDIDFSISPKGAGNLRIPIANVPNYANDAAAAAGGVIVGGIYRNGSALQVRVS